MSVKVTEHTRQMLAQSMWDVAQKQVELTKVIARNLQMEESERPRQHVERSVALLVDLLISQAHSLVEKGHCLGLDHEQSILSQEDVGTRELAPFGDGLAEALPTVVPACRKAHVTSAWCDAFWGIVLSLPRPSRRAYERGDRGSYEYSKSDTACAKL